MLSVVVPTFNERDNVEPLIDRVLDVFRSLPEPAELIVVDDGSPDGTAATVRAYAGQRGVADRVRVVERYSDPGLARAVLAGFAQARGDVLAAMDADLSHPPEVLAKLLEAVRCGADMAVGSRYVAQGDSRAWPAFRQLISRGACILARGLTAVRDATSGFFAVRRDAVDLQAIRPRGYKIALELMARLDSGRIREIPITFTDRTRGQSKIGKAVMAAYLFQLAALYRARFPILLGYAQFAIVGLGGMVVDAVTFVMAFHALALEGVAAGPRGFLAQTLSFVVAAGFNFVVNAAWTFRDRSIGASFYRFLGVSAIGFLLRSLVFQGVLMLPLGMATGGRWPGIEMLALACGVGVASVWNYFGSLRFAFTGGPRPPLTLPDPPTLRVSARAVAVLATIGVLLVWFASQTPLAHDEAYYWQWSRHLAWGYFDHPPMIAYLIGAGTRLLGHNELGVRLVPLLMALAIPWVAWDLARRYWQSGIAGAWALAAMICMPLAAVGMTLATPDAPQVAFWALALLATVRALETQRLGYWLLAGVATGLGLLSKYPMVLIYPVLGLALLLLPRGRRALGTSGPWLAAGASVVLASPMLAWQLEQGGSGLLFQLRHGLGPVAGGDGSGPPGLAGLGEFVAGQVGVVSPVLFVIVLVAFVRALFGVWREREVTLRGPVERTVALRPAELRVLLVLATGVPLAVFGLASLLARPEANWPATMYVSAIALGGGELARIASAARPWRWLSWGGVALAAVLSLYVHVELVRPLAPYSGGAVVQTHGHGALAEWVDAKREAIGGDAPVLASDYKLASVLAFYLADRPETCTPLEEESGSAYYAWQPRPEPGRRALYISRGEAEDVGRVLAQARALGRHETRRAGVVVRTVRAYVGRVRAGACDRP